jgi:hypothetical protein
METSMITKALTSVTSITSTSTMTTKLVSTHYYIANKAFSQAASAVANVASGADYKNPKYS